MVLIRITDRHGVASCLLIFMVLGGFFYAYGCIKSLSSKESAKFLPETTIGLDVSKLFQKKIITILVM